MSGRGAEAGRSGLDEEALHDVVVVLGPDQRDVGLRAVRDLKAGDKIAESDLEALRPAPRDAIFPFDIGRVLGRKPTRDISKGDYPKWTHVA